eukprot:5868413-Pleurochrysis_carterae.AAC.1
MSMVIVVTVPARGSARRAAAATMGLAPMAMERGGSDGGSTSTTRPNSSRLRRMDGRGGDGVVERGATGRVRKGESLKSTGR